MGQALFRFEGQAARPSGVVGGRLVAGGIGGAAHAVAPRISELSGIRWLIFIKRGKGRSS